MFYKIKINQFISVDSKEKTLVVSYLNKKIFIQLENTLFVYFKEKERTLYIKILELPNLKIKENFYKKILSRIIAQIKMVKKAVSQLKKEPKNLVFVIGLGYRFDLLKGKLFLNLGFSHDVEIQVPSGIQLFRPKENILVLKGVSSEKLHLFMSVLQKYKKPDPYKNKGICLNWRILKNKKITKKG